MSPILCFDTVAILSYMFPCYFKWMTWNSYKFTLLYLNKVYVCVCVQCMHIYHLAEKKIQSDSIEK